MANTSRKSRFSTALSAHWMPSSNKVRKVTSENYPTDAGREGELIFRLVYQQAGCKKPFSRLWISSMEDSAIQKGFANLKPSTEYDSLYNAALCRERADWMVGINNFMGLTSDWEMAQIEKALKCSLALDQENLVKNDSKTA